MNIHNFIHQFKHSTVTM